MQKLFLLGLLIGNLLYVSPSTEDLSECVLKKPTSERDCFDSEPLNFKQTCCYFEGTYEDTDGTMTTGKACLEADRIDVSNGTIKHETQKKIEAGTYWADYPPITDIKSFLCYDEISECEKKKPVKSASECFKAKPELLSEGCCYIEADWEYNGKYEEEMVGFCLDIRLEDSLTKKKVQETITKLKNGSYWEGANYGFAHNIQKLVCANTQNSFMMKVNFLILSLLLFIF